MLQFGKSPQAAIAAYVNHVRDGVDLPNVWEQPQGQLLGDAKFAEVLGEKMGDKLAADEEIPRPQRRKSAPPLARFAAMPERTTAIVQAFATGCYGMTEIAQGGGNSQCAVYGCAGGMQCKAL